MARQPRVVAPGYPHHITQRGNRRQPTFFEDSDYKLYLALLKEECDEHEMDVWAYCLMPNHVHLILVPQTEEGLAKMVGRLHRRYTRKINERMEWQGYLWQGRFASFPMDESYLLSAVRYVELNPVKAGLVDLPEEYSWSSAGFHLGLRSDPVISRTPLDEIIGNWRQYLIMTDNEYENRQMRVVIKNGHPLGREAFVSSLQQLSI